MEEEIEIAERIEKDEDILNKRKEKFVKFIKLKSSWIFYILLAFILWINWQIRTLPMKINPGTGKPYLTDITTGGWALGPDLDPFLFLRYAKEIVEKGFLANVDMMRYIPLGFNSAGETTLLPYMIAWTHKFLSFFGNVTIEYSAVIFPAIISIFTAIAFFLLVRKIFEIRGEKESNIIALISTSLLVMLPSLLTRTIAGIPEKESVGFFFMFLAFYFFISAWKSEKLRNSIILGVLAGVSTACMGMIWGGVIYIFTTIAIATFIAFVFGKASKKVFFMYSSWLLSFVFILLFFSNRFSIIGLVGSTSSGLSFAVFGFLLVDFVLFHTKFEENKIVRKLKEIKLPDKFISIIVAGILAIILVIIMFGPLFIFNFTGDIIEHLTTPYTDRLSFTIAENRQPFFSGEWQGNFGPHISGIPLFFWLFLIGSIFLFYEMTKELKKDGLILTGSYVIFLFALIFSKYAPNNILDGISGFSKLIYFGGILLLGLTFVYVYYNSYKKKDLENYKKINFSYIFLITYFTISLLAARSAVRLIMGLTPVASIIISYFAVSRVQKVLKKNQKDDLMKMVAWGIMILVVLATIFTVYSYYGASKATAASYVIDRYRLQWQKAMGWVRENTEPDIVFSHWWDYGYWVQTMGERATVLDGGNVHPYWDYLMGRHVLTAESEEEALEFMYTHNSSYLLIDSTDIGKYSAYSSIGSDEKYDRYSWIGTFVLNEQGTQEKRNGTLYFYEGGVGLDEDLLWEQNNEKIFLPAQSSGVAGIMVEQKSNGALEQPIAIFVYNNKRIDIPLRYVYYNGSLYDFQSGYGGTLYIIPRVIQEGGGVRVNNLGAAMFLSERNMRALWVRLYLLGEGERFNLVHNEPSFVIESLKGQGIDVGDFAFFGGVEGPIKIWNTEFPKDMKINPEYLELDYPSEGLREATIY